VTCHCAQQTVTAPVESGVTPPVGAALPFVAQEPAEDTPAIMPTIWLMPMSLQRPKGDVTRLDPGSEQADMVYDVTLVSVHETAVGEPQLQLPRPQVRLSTTAA